MNPDAFLAFFLSTICHFLCRGHFLLSILLYDTILNTCARTYKPTNGSRLSSRHVFTLYIYILTNTHTPVQPTSQPSIKPCSLMFVKVINFLCEIRDHGSRTEGDGCQPQNLPLLSSTDTSSMSPQPSHGHRGYPRIPRALTNKGSQQGERRKTQMKEHF